VVVSGVWVIAAAHQVEVTAIDAPAVPKGDVANLLLRGYPSTLIGIRPALASHERPHALRARS
jgi:hypothetical protein